MLSRVQIKFPGTLLAQEVEFSYILSGPMPEKSISSPIIPFSLKITQDKFFTQFWKKFKKNIFLYAYYLPHHAVIKPEHLTNKQRVSNSR